MKLNREIIWLIFGMVLVIVSYVLLEKGNAQNTVIKHGLIGLFSSFVVKLILQVKKNK